MNKIKPSEKWEERFRKKFIPASLKWKDAIHCLCCTTAEDLKEMEKFIRSLLKEEREKLIKEWNEQLIGEAKQKIRQKTLEDVEIIILDWASYEEGKYWVSPGNLLSKLKQLSPKNLNK